MITSPTRREFLCHASAAVGVLAAGSSVLSAQPKDAMKLHLATNQYPWFTFYRREGKDYGKLLDTAMSEMAASGMDGLEPIIDTPAQVDELGSLLKKHGLQLRSFYVNSTLHTPDADKSIDQVVSVAAKAKATLGTKIVVTNPSPIRWGGPENKDDAQLRTQAAAMNKLGEKLSAIGMVLSYHNHDIELRNAAREFHHMMAGTDPRHVTLCLDAHWIYRGAGSSSVALFDVLKLYGPRISELHLRQSAKNVWTEAFGEGDIDYVALAQHVQSLGLKPHIVLEQCVESATPKTMTAPEAHRQGGEYARKVFAAFA